MIQLAWLFPSDTAQRRSLFIRLHPGDRWQPYTSFPQYCKPDDPGNSRGYATMQYCRQKYGAELISCAEAEGRRDAA